MTSKSPEMHKLARPMLTGVPCRILSGRPEGIKNKMVNDMLGDLPQFIGEIVVGAPEAPNCHEVTQDWLNQPNAVFLFVFWVYDIRTESHYALRDRLKIAETFVSTCGPNTQFVDHALIESKAELDYYRNLVIAERGFPGIVLREPFGTFGTEDEKITQA